ncbi:hypothetical protein [Flavobacterium crocinum]|uniref:hypothetical protein n=1 Tax=Flavobacterium crocinum TaxID=2183896 RepID=UPI00142E6D45|nr:hypothetical protein [Flavobacterium crocinum]
MNLENQLPVLIEENQLLERFQVEELEKRYEFGWTVVVGPLDPPDNPIPLPEPPMPF